MMEAKMTMHRATGRRMAMGVLLALVLAAGTVPAARAGSRVGFVLLPPMPVTSVPGGPIAAPTLPGSVPTVLPPSPLGSPAPAGTYFTPPVAVPMMVPGGPSGEH
jgi:hypothetical protein